MIRHDVDQKAVLSWYTGKNLENAKKALDTLLLSASQGYWIPKASRTIDAALSKANVAIKALQAADRQSQQAGEPTVSDLGRTSTHLSRGHFVYMGLRFGYRHYVKITPAEIEALESEAKNDATRKVIRLAAKHRADFAPVYALIAELDATRPPPVVTEVGASPTITKTLEAIGVTGNVTTIRMCPRHYEKIEYTNREGKKETIHLIVLDWPKGTVHNTSRFSHQSDQCEACGHGIKNPFNWVPMLIDDAQGVPHSIWVGRDCAETFFGVKVVGEMHIKGME